MRVIIRRLMGGALSKADVYLYKFTSPSKPEQYMSQDVNDKKPAYYFEVEPHILIYQVINECGSYQKGIRLVW